MNVKSAEKKENSTVELIIEVPAEEFEAAVEKVYRKNKGSIAIPGFRKGKAPRKIIESMYGSGVFYEDAVEEVYPTAYSEAVKEQGLEVVAYPHVEVVSVGKDGLTFKATVTVKPEVTLGQYKGLAAPKAEVTVTDEDIDHELAPLIERATRLVSVDREAKLGDTAVIDFEGFVDGKAFEGGKGSNYRLELGSGSFVPGFEDGVVGMKAGEEKDINITFPKEYTPELAGKDAVFHVKVSEVKEKVPPVVDDEFAKDVSEFDTLADLKKDLGDKLRERRQADADRDYENALMEQVCDNLGVELPEPMIDFKTDELVQDFAQRISAQGIPFEEYLKYMGIDVNSMKTQMRPNAIANLKSGLALEAIAAAEGLEVAAEEVEAEIAKMAEQYNMEAEKIKAAVPEEDLKHDLLLRKAARLVVDNGKIGEAPKKEEAEGEEKPAKKTAAKKTAKKAEEAEGEEKPAKKTAAKKTAAKKTAKKAEEAEGEEKPAKKAAAKKSTKKTEE